MKWPRVAFVAAPEVDAETLFDFNDDLVLSWPESEGFSLGEPELSGDPDGIGAEYGLRDLEFSLVIRAHKAEALAKQSALARQMWRRRNWLLFQLTETTAPVWFRTWRPRRAGALSFDHVYNGKGKPMPDRWAIRVSIPAEPYAVGERVTLSAATVNLDPAATSNPCSLVIPPQRGDAPTPLQVDVEWSTTRDGYRSLVASTPERSAPIVWQVGTGDSWTPGPATEAGAAYANTSGGSARPFAATGTLQTIVSGPAPAALPAGRYRLWARVLRETTDGEFAMRFTVRYRSGAAGVTGPYTFTAWGTTAADHATWVDLGEHSFPAGQPTPEGVMVTPDVSMAAYRTSGTGGFRLDAFMVQPVTEDSRTLLVDRGYGPATGAVERVDGESESVAHRLAGVPQAMAAPALAGGFPMLRPGVENLLTLLSQTDVNTARFAGAETPDRVADTATVTVSYQPWWLWIGDS